VWCETLNIRKKVPFDVTGLQRGTTTPSEPGGQCSMIHISHQSSFNVLMDLCMKFMFLLAIWIRIF
jgi:hypothetical protein